MATCEGSSWALLLILSVAVLPLVLSTNSKYIVTAPAKARRGYMFTVNVALLVPSGPSTVEVTITDLTNQVLVGPVTGSFVGNDANEQKLITMKIEDTLSAGKHYLIVESKSGVVFRVQQDLQVLAKTGLVLIQTDKAMYKESQKVLIRTAAIGSDAKPLNTHLDIIIKDPNDNKLAHYKDLTPDHGVVNVDFELVNDPVLGEWTITAMGTTMPEIVTERTFTVDKYVLPKYSVEANLPGFVMLYPGSNDGQLTVDVIAKYTYGKPVNGRAIVVVTSGNRINEMEKTLVNGMASFTASVYRSEVIAYRYRAGNPEAVVKVRVIEAVTNKEEKFEGSVPMFVEPYKMAFINEDGSFIYDMPLNIFLKVTDSAGGSIPAADRSALRVKVKFTLSNTWTANEALLPTLDLTMPATGDVIVTRANIPTKVLMNNQTFQMMAELTYPTVSSTGVHDVAMISAGPQYKNPVSTLTQLGITVGVVGATDQIQSPDKTLPAGQSVTFRVVTTVAEPVFYEVHAKGLLLVNGILTTVHQASTGLYISDFDVAVTSKMAPNAVVVVYTNTATDEIVADSQTFSVSGLLKHNLNVRFDNDLKEVGDIAQMTVVADPNSVVFVSAIDKKTTLLGKPNNIDLPQLLEGLEEFDLTAEPKDDAGFGCGGCGIMFKRRRRDVREVESNGGITTTSILRDAGVMMMTDSIITDAAVNRFFPEMEFDNEMVAMAPADEGMQRKGDVEDVSGSDLDSAATVRKNFPETWIWKNINIGSSGTNTTNHPVPDTITSWVVNTFSMNTQTGIDLDLTPPSLTVMKKMFVSLSLPYSVIRGEKFKLFIYVFNYFNNPLSVDVTLAASNDFKASIDASKEILDDLANAEHVALTKSGLQVPSNSSNGFFVWIYPTTLGNIKLRITAVSPKKTDIVEQTLLVEPEGKTEYGASSFVIKHDTDQTYDFMMQALPTEGSAVVAGSKSTYVTVTGDIMGSTIDNLDRLVRQPCGCGEQNMITLVPNIFVRKYLAAIKDVVDPTLVELTNKYMKMGYQREQNYKHTDGSYSAFGESDPSGSTWLTGFVVKSFAMAKEFITNTVDEGGISKSVDWLILQLDKRTSTFNEPGHVIHSEMMGGSTSSKYTLTAVVYISMKEAMAAMPLTAMNLDSKLADVLTALETNYQLHKDTWVMDRKYFKLAVMAYAFALGGSSYTSDALQKLKDLSKQEDGMMYWTMEKETAFKKNGRLYCSPPSGPSDIETASYVILAYTKLGNAIESRLVQKWLLSQLSGDGGFKSTQDTVMGLQAIATLAVLLGRGSTGMGLAIEYSASGIDPQTLTVDDNNKFLLQKTKLALPEDVVNVTFRITGKGQAMLALLWKYNVLESPSNGNTNKFNLRTRTEAINYDIFDIMIDLQLLDTAESGGMALVSYTPPSGFSTDLDRVTGVSRKEINGKTVTLYLNSLEMEQKELRLQSYRTQDVADVKSGVVSVEMYYNPVVSKTVTYDLPDTVKLTACQLSGDMDDVCPKPRNPNAASSITQTKLLLPLISLLVVLMNLI